MSSNPNAEVIFPGLLPVPASKTLNEMDMHSSDWATSAVGQFYEDPQIEVVAVQKALAELIDYVNHLESFDDVYHILEYLFSHISTLTIKRYNILQRIE